MTKQALGKCASETFNNGLLSVNLSALTAHIGFVVFHFFGQTPHVLVARVNLEHLRLSQRAALVNRLKCLCNVSSLSRSEAQILKNGWQSRQRSARIYRLCVRGTACRVAEKGQLDGPN